MADTIQFDPALKQLLLERTGSPLGEAMSEELGAREVPVVARLVDPSIEVEILKIVSRFGNIVTGRTYLNDLVTLRQNQNIASLKASATFGGALAISIPEIRASSDLLRVEFPPAGVTGRGVVIAFADWGCDFAHANLRNPHGGTRLLFLWDQRGGTQLNSPAPFGYGRLFHKEQIDAALAQPDPYAALGYDPAQSDDGTGTHCTHVMDIAAGNGQAPGSSPGVAPEADLICVHLKGDDTQPEDTLGDSVRVLEALRFIVDYADDRPLVINLSLGKTGGPHDGSILVTQALDSLLNERAGCMVVMSTGNYFDANVHSAGQLHSGEHTDLRWNVIRRNEEMVEMEVWYPESDEFSVELINPMGSSLGPVALGEDHIVREEGRIIASIYHRRRDPNNGDHQIDIFLWPDVPTGRWTTRLYGEQVNDGRYHAWIERSRPEVQARFEPHSSTPTITTGTICNGLKTLAIGAYDARLPSFPLGSFSSAGPTRDGRPIPVVSAPGVAIRAARSSYPTPAGRIMNDLTVKSGTSMAAPHVSGVIALMFEAAGDYRLTAEQTREILTTTARPFPTDDQYHRYGAGRVDAAAAVKRVREFIQNQAKHDATLVTEDELSVLPIEIMPASLNISKTREVVRPEVSPTVSVSLSQYPQQKRNGKMKNNSESYYSAEERVFHWLNSINNSAKESQDQGLLNYESEWANTAYPNSDVLQWLLQHVPKSLMEFKAARLLPRESEARKSGHSLRVHHSTNISEAMAQTNSYADDVITFPGTTFKYKKCKRSLQSCLDTLSPKLRADFRKNIEIVITQMYELGFALGTRGENNGDDYRTFQQQYNVTETNAGPGESFHQYGLAVDLGFLEWIDKDGNSYTKDFWLSTMDTLPGYDRFSTTLWDKRDGFRPADVYLISWERIHMQGVKANKSGRDALVKTLNEASVNGWKYRKNGIEEYDCDFGEHESWKKVGTAKQMWNKDALNATISQQQIIRDDMEAAESKALTIDI